MGGEQCQKCKEEVTSQCCDETEAPDWWYQCAKSSLEQCYDGVESQCKGFSGIKLLICRLRSKMNCCTDDKKDECKGCSGEQCQDCKQDNRDKCCNDIGLPDWVCSR